MCQKRQNIYGNRLSMETYPYDGGSQYNRMTFVTKMIFDVDILYRKENKRSISL